MHLGGSARGKEIYTWDKSTWLEQEHSHIERIEEFVQLLRRNRTIVENELRAELSELETQAFAIKEESMRNSGPELSSKRSAALYEDWKSKRRQQDADRVGRFKQLYSERIQEHQDRQRDLQAEKEKQQKLAAEKAQKEAEDRKVRLSSFVRTPFAPIVRFGLCTLWLPDSHLLKPDLLGPAACTGT